MSDHPESRIPLRLNDEELIVIGAYVRGDIVQPETAASAIASVGMKLTKFFIDVAKTAVEHYDREHAPEARCIECEAGKHTNCTNEAMTEGGEIVACPCATTGHGGA